MKVSKTCVCTLDTASWSEDTFANVCRHFSIFPTAQICLPDNRGPGVGRAEGEHPTDLSVTVMGALILPA